MNNKSPLRYPGGKTRACKILDEILTNNFKMKDFKVVVSPFFGGGSFEFFLQKKYGYSIVANDKFYPLYNFWNVCKERKNELVTDLGGKVGKITSSVFKEYRESIMKDEDVMSNAMKYFVINRCSFSGATLSGGYSQESSESRFTVSSVERVGKLDLKDLSISNLDFEVFLEQDFGRGSFIFLDPPYYLGSKSKLYGKNGDMHENFKHEALEECLRGKSDWLLTYNDCDYIRKLYSGYTIIDSSWAYGMNKSKKSSEIFIIKNII